LLDKLDREREPNFTPPNEPLYNVPAEFPKPTEEKIESPTPTAEEIAEDLHKKEQAQKTPKERALSVKDLLGIPKTKKGIDHTLFLKALGTLENRHPIVLAKEIVLYAKSIVESDKETSDRLLKIANNILKG
jgi:hypothetical protein